ncbi:phage tail protein [Clostridium felsineum]|uniref:phage tail spike protein n=1 Tax=Clostridium felsineum TaxID=36839 RepID=UPI00214DE768|nr:phage tail spike protein [Clostridium felsineum]MCR3760429.1 phage tail protein [Clostridium felsineum]
MIILYDKNKISGFDRNDLVLRNVTKCEVTWEKNGQFQINLVYPILNGDTTWQSIVKGAIVKCPVAYQQDQLFRLNTPAKKMDENSGYFFIEVTGYHITYDLNDNFLEDVRPTSKSGIEAGQYILANTQYSHSFNWIGDITDINTAYYIRKNPINALIGDDDNSYLNRWGGELVRDNFNIGVFKQAGQNRGVIIRYSKNLTGFEQSGDDSNLMTRCLPYCTIDTSSTDNTDNTGTTDTNTDEDLKPVLKLPERYIDSPLINNYSHPYVKAVEVQLTTDQQKFTDEQKYKLMRNYVADLYQSKHVDVPVYSYSVNFIDLANTEEYKDYAILEEVHPYDFVTVKALDIDVIAELVGYTYNSLTKQYNTITLGNIQNDIIRHNQKSLFQISKQNEQSIRILQAQMQDVPNSMLDIVTQTTSGGNNLFDHSVLESKYESEWTNSGASIISDNTLHDTDKVWELPAGANVTKQDIILNPDSYKGQQLTFSLSAKYNGLDITYDSSLGAVSSAKLGSISIKYKKCLANSIAGNWITNGNTGIITDYIPIDAGKAFTISNSEGYAYKLLAYDSSYNFVEDFTSSTSTPNYPFIRVEIDKSNMYPESITGFSIYENTEREFQDVAYLYADSVSSDWKVCSTTFALATANSSDVITHVNFTASNEDSSGTIYVAGFMLNTGTVRSDYSQSSNDTVQTLRVHQVYADYIEANKADFDKLHATNATIDTLSSTYATITNLNAANGNINNLKASVGNIMDLTTNTLKANIIDTAQLKTGAITADSGIIAQGAIQTAQIADGSVTDAKILTLTANKLTAGTIDAGVITVKNLTADNITTGTINGERIGPKTITTSKIDDKAVNTAQIADNAITASLISANTITGDKLVMDTITAREIASKTITANEIAANTITADKIHAGTLTSASGVFGDISANNIKTGTLDASIVTVTNINANNITSGTISASRINGGTLTLGGGNNGSGTEVIYDSRGLEIVRIDNKGITITQQVTPDGFYENSAFLIKDYQGTVLMYIDGAGQMNYYGAMSVRSLETTGNMITYADGKQALKTANVIEMSVINDANNDNSTYLAVNTSLHNRGIQSWISDIRLKENIKDSEVDALSKICAIKCRQFDWKESHTHQDLGVVSQELRKIEPTMAYGVKQPDDSLLYQPDESILIPYLIKSVQQLKQEIETLKTEISQLKGSI